MGRFTEQQITHIRELENSQCENCYKTVAIDRYGITPTMVRMLDKMIEGSKPENDYHVDVKVLGFTHTEHSQITKLRYHAFIRKAKGAENMQIPNTWIVNPKGYDFMFKQKLVPAKVDTYNNDVIGHSDDVTDLAEVLKKDKHGADREVLERRYITAAQGKTITELQQSSKPQVHNAEFRGYDYTGRLKKGYVYTIKVRKLAFGHPVHLIEPKEHTYKDVATFTNDWRVVR